MKNIYLVIATVFLFINACFSQVTVTNPANIGPAPLTATYPSLAAAITDLNTRTTISGPVTITLTAGNPQTAPAGGYAITAVLAGASTTNTVTFEGSSNTIQSSAALVAGAVNDAIFKLVGADYITIQHFTMQEDPANAITASGTNNMTEWGVALLQSSVTDGAQNNTIQNNTISLSRVYANTFGIYSNARHSATVVSVINDITNNTTAPHNNNKVYGNTISDVNMGITFVGSNTATNMDVGNDIGGSSVTTGNTITNWGGASAVTAFVSNSGTSYCIYVNNQASENVSYNTCTSAAVSGTAVDFRGIYKNYTSMPTGTFTSTISYNTLTLSSSFSSGFFRAIESTGIGGLLGTATINITNNSILNCVVSGVAASTTIFGIYNGSSPGTLNINYNVISGTGSTATTGGFTGIFNIGSVENTINITNNHIGNASANAVTFSVATTGTITAIRNVAAGSTAVVNITNNSIDRINAVASNNAIIIYQQGDAATININNNALGTATGVLLTYSNAGSGSIDGILNSGGGLATTLNINNNSIDGVFVVNCGSFIPIRNLAPNVGVAINMEYNALGTATGTLITTSGAQSAGIFGLYNNGGSSTTAISIQYNDITGIVHSVLASCNHEYILNNKAGASNLVSNNTFTNLSVNTTGQVTMIAKSGDMISGATTTISNNSIVTAFNKTGNGGTVYMYYSSAASASGSTVTVTGNIFSNVTVTGSCNISVFNHNDGASVASAPSCNFSGNTLNNIVYQTGQFTGFSIQRGLGVNISTNTITNVLGGGDCTAIYYSSSIGTGTLNINANSISSLSSATSSTRGIYGSSTNVTTANIYNNTLTGFSAGGFNGLTGILAASGTALNIYGNQISNLSTSSNGLPVLNGIELGTHTTVNIYNNQIYNLLSTGAVTSTAPAVKGISFSGAATAAVYNNFVADLKATAANLTDAIRGISVTSTTAGSTFNFYYNSIYINATSTGTNFGSSGIYHTADVTATTAALNMINNIIVNTSTAKGTGVTAAYRRSGTALDNYAATSDYNLFYAGTPSVTRLIFYDGTNSDQTLSAYQTRVSTREANSISVMPNFVSSTNLHLQFSLNCQIEGRGTPVSGITTDIDAQTRNATTPDIGADEFTGGLPLEPEPALVSTCENRNVSATGTTYISPYCSLIARVEPSGADPVSGRVSACVTLDATQQYFNGEPYVQRHFDIEPATANQTSTSATITLYFTDSEFELYNTNNPAWPKLPTEAGGAMTDPNRANLKITQFHGVASTSPSSPGNYPGNWVLIDPVDADIDFVLLGTGYWAVTFPVMGFSGFYVHTNNFNAPLPFIVNYLTGRKQGSNHLLNWKVICNSTPHITITLERSLDARNFTGITTITADAARCNQPFDYTDANPLTGMNYYRLKMVDANGKVTYSTTVALLNAVKGFDIVSIAPNPVVADNFKLNVASAQAGNMEFVIFDMQGRLVNRQTISVIAGFNSLPVNVANLPPGTYTIRGNIAGDKFKIIRFVKQ